MTPDSKMIHRLAFEEVKMLHKLGVTQMKQGIEKMCAKDVKGTTAIDQGKHRHRVEIQRF